MPGGIRFFEKDPNKRKGRYNIKPKGVYYHRGHGWWSKYSLVTDVLKKSRGWRVDVVGLYKGSRKRTRIPQTSDGNLPR